MPTLFDLYKEYDLKISKEEEQRALEIHEKSIVVDGSEALEKTDTMGDKWFNRRKGVVTAVNLTVPGSIWKGFPGAVQEMYSVTQWINENSSKGLLATSVKDIERAKRDDSIAVIFGPQDSTIIENELAFLECLYKFGLRIMQLTYQKRNLIGDGCGERTNCGLSDFGIDVIEKMNKLGIVVDLGHVGKASTLEAIDFSKDPTIFSHADPRGVTNHVRNKDDDVIKALAERGGVMAPMPYSPCIEMKRGVRPTLEDYFCHIEYTINLVGVDHVGIASDLIDGMTQKSHGYFVETYPECFPDEMYVPYETCYAQGCEAVTFLPVITKGLVVRGYSDQEIKKILGGNFLRVFKQVWGE